MSKGSKAHSGNRHSPTEGVLEIKHPQFWEDPGPTSNLTHGYPFTGTRSTPHPPSPPTGDTCGYMCTPPIPQVTVVDICVLHTSCPHPRVTLVGICALHPSRPLPRVTLTYLANFTVVAFRGTKPVWNWTWNIFMDAICRESKRREQTRR